jgi:predicted dienelactone hydrolase
MRIRIAPLLLAALTLAAGCASDDDKPRPAAEPVVKLTPGSYSASESPIAVGAIPEASLHDAQRNRDLEMTVEYPTSGGPYPVIVFSHGYGGSNDGYVALTEYWTGHGFVCIKPKHADAGALQPMLADRRKRRQEAMEKMREQRRERRGQRAPDEGEARTQPEEPLAENVWKTQSEADWRNRVRDITFILDSLDALEAKYPELKGKVDHTKIGVGGHSYGAFTAMLVGGAKTFKGGTAQSYADPRVRAIVAMSPQGTGAGQGLTAASWSELRIPALFMTGSLDRGAGDENWRKEAFTNSPPGDKYFISIEGARHMSFTGRFADLEDELPMFDERRGGSMARPTTDAWGNVQQQPRDRTDSVFERERRVFAAVKLATVAFWDAYLKGDAKARDYLTTSSKSLAGGNLTFESK